ACPGRTAPERRAPRSLPAGSIATQRPARSGTLEAVAQFVPVRAACRGRFTRLYRFVANTAGYTERWLLPQRAMIGPALAEMGGGTPCKPKKVCSIGSMRC